VTSSLDDAQRGALEAVERILNRGGEPEQVLRDVHAALAERLSRESQALSVEELERSTGDAEFARRVITLVSPYLDKLPRT
jgi:hypothetical protein